MEVLIIGNRNLQAMTIPEIKRNICGKHPDLLVEKELIRRITLKEKCATRVIAQDYFISDFSITILSYVSQRVYGKSCFEEILGEYYIFISKENKQTPYYKLTLYNHINDSSFRNYVSTITIRYFTGLKKKNDKAEKLTVSIDGSTTTKKEKNGDEVIDNPWYRLLVSSRGDDGSTEITPETYEKIEYVFSKLPPRDVKVIQLLVMEGMSCLDAFEELKDDLAKTARIPVATWTKKQKQNAMALQRAKSIKHFKKIVENEKIDF